VTEQYSSFVNVCIA